MLAQNFRVHEWGVFLETPIEAVVQIVKEFSANGRDLEYVKHDISWVRRKAVSYNSPKINRLSGLTSPLFCDFVVNFKCPAFEFVSVIMSVIAHPESE